MKKPKPAKPPRPIKQRVATVTAEWCRRDASKIKGPFSFASIELRIVEIYDRDTDKRHQELIVLEKSRGSH